MTQKETNRRRFLATTAAGMGIASTAGCLGIFDGGDSSDDTNTTDTDTTTDTQTDTSNGTDTQTETDTEDNETETNTTDEETTTEPEDTPTSVDEYLADTGNYDGTIADETGDDSIDVMVGVEGNGPGAQAFDPVAIEISPGTTVRWVWTGDGGRHKVIHEDGEFESGAVGVSSHTYEYTFDEPGTYLYYCGSHKDINMRGAIVVSES